MPRDDSVGPGAGRGFAYLLGAKVFFLITGYGVIVALGWLLGPVLYGVYGLVLGAIQVIDNVIVTGTIQAVSRFTSEAPNRAGPVKVAALRMQALLGGAAAAVFALSAPLLAAFERDPSLTPYLRLASAVVLLYALYSVFVGSLNGQRRFGLQAGLDALYAALRAGLVVGLAAAGLAVWGAISGFVAASLLILLVAVAWVGVGEGSGPPFPVGRLLRFVLPVMGYLLLVNLVMYADLFLLKRYAVEAAPGSAGEVVGVYVAAQQLARVTYQALMAVTFVAFPLVSRVTSAGDEGAARHTITATMRYGLLLAAGIAAILASMPGPALGLPFGDAFRSGAPALAILAPGYAFFSLFMVATSILNAAGRPRTAMLVTAGVLAAEMAACWIVIPRASSAEVLLTSAAACAAGAMALGWAASAVTLRLAFGAPLGLATLLRVSVAYGAAMVTGRLLPESGRGATAAECLLVGLVYLAALFATREMGRRELRQLAVVMGLRR